MNTLVEEELVEEEDNQRNSIFIVLCADFFFDFVSAANLAANLDSFAASNSAHIPISGTARDDRNLNYSKFELGPNSQ